MLGTNIIGQTLYGDTPKGYSASIKNIYHFRAVATDGTDTWYGGDLRFLVEEGETKQVNTFFALPF